MTNTDLLAIGLTGIVHDVFAAARPRRPGALSLHVREKEVILSNLGTILLILICSFTVDSRETRLAQGLALELLVYLRNVIVHIAVSLYKIP